MIAREGGFELRVDPRSRVSYSTLINQKNEWQIPEKEVPLKSEKHFTLIGQPIQLIDMPAKINNYLESTNQNKISDKGQMVKVILESLAVKYYSALEKIEKLSAQKIDTLHIVGGGSQNQLLNKFRKISVPQKKDYINTF